MTKTLYHTLSGSQLTGLTAPTSDRDTLSVVAYPLECYLGVSGYSETSHVKEGENDVLVHEARKFARLAMAGNYACLSSLFAPADKVLFMHDAFRPFVANAFSFVSRKSVAACVGQALTDYKTACNDYANNTKAAARAYHLMDEARRMMEYGSPGVDASWTAKQLRAGELRLHEFWNEFEVLRDEVKRMEADKHNFLRNEVDAEFVSALVMEALMAANK